jgi:hypothetical protein
MISLIVVTLGSKTGNNLIEVGEKLKMNAKSSS